jgi:GNAT superfamily N-acetyltransferase
MENESSITIRPAEPGDEAQWRPLWAGYCAFYETEVPEEVTAALWNRIIGTDEVTYGLVAVNESGDILGFTHYILHPHTWSSRTLCYLEDLYVTPEARGQRIGQRLIESVIALGRENGWKRVYWHTEEDNTTARRVYDRFVPADAYVRYTVSL